MEASPDTLDQTQFCLTHCHSERSSSPQDCKFSHESAITPREFDCPLWKAVFQDGGIEIHFGACKSAAAPGLTKCSLVQRGHQKSLPKARWSVWKQPRAKLPPIPARPARLAPLLKTDAIVVKSSDVRTTAVTSWTMILVSIRMVDFLSLLSHSLPGTEHIKPLINRQWYNQRIRSTHP